MKIPGDRATRSKLTILVIFTIWTSVVFLSPFTLPANSVDDLSGRVGTIDNEQEITDMNLFAKAIYTAGDVYCHQISERSFDLNGNQMPFCARDVALFLGLVIGMILAISMKLELSILILALGLTPLAADGLLQLLSSYESSNLVRVITGLLGGGIISLILSRFADRMLGNHENSTLREDEKS